MNKVYIDKVKVYKRNKRKNKPKIAKEGAKNIEPVVDELNDILEPVIVNELNDAVEPVVEELNDLIESELVEELNDIVEPIVEENSLKNADAKIINPAEIRYNNKVEIRYNGNKRKNNIKVNKAKANKGNVKKIEPVLIDRIFDCVETCVKEHSPRCTDFEITSPDNIPFNSKVDICEANVKIKIKKICNKIFIQGNEIDTGIDNEIPSNETNIINIDESLINICSRRGCTRFDLKVNEWVEACVEIVICIKGIAYVGESFDEVEFEAVGVVEDEVCIPLMYCISVPNFIGSDNIPYLKQCNSIQAFVDENFIFLSALPDENANIEKLLGKFVITYCVCSEVESIVPNWVETNNKKNKISKPKRTEITRDKITMVNKRRA